MIAIVGEIVEIAIDDPATEVGATTVTAIEGAHDLDQDPIERRRTNPPATGIVVQVVVVKIKTETEIKRKTKKKIKKKTKNERVAAPDLKTNQTKRVKKIKK